MARPQRKAAAAAKTQPVVKKSKPKPKPHKKKPKSQRRKSEPQYLSCPVSGDKIWIVQATLQDIQQAARKGKQPFGNNRQYLVKVSSPTARNQVYETAAKALQCWEEGLLPDYGGRPWQVQVRVQDPSTPSKPYFRWYKGQLELAAWPHIIQKIPDPPRFPGYSTGNSAKKKPSQDNDDAMSVNDSDDDDEEEAPLTPEEKQIQALQERATTGLSELAWQERWRVPLPLISIKWISPLREIFYSRKSAWERAVQLCKNEVQIDKVLAGYGSSGQRLKLQMPTRKAVLQAGLLRFERDGLWVIGQEEKWQEERLLEQEALDNSSSNSAGSHDPKEEAKTRGMTGLAYYLKCCRKEHQSKRLAELCGARQETREPSLTRGSMVLDLEDHTDEHDDDAKISASVSAGTSVPLEPQPSVGQEPTNRSTAGSMVLDLEDHSDEQDEVSNDQAGATCASIPVESHESTLEPMAMDLENHTDKPDEEKANDSASVAKSPSISLEPQPCGGGDLCKAEGTAKACAVEDSKHSTRTGKVSFTLREAEGELRMIWKTLSKDERQSWTNRAKVFEQGGDPSAFQTLSTSASLGKSDQRADVWNEAGRVTPPTDSETTHPSPESSPVENKLVDHTSRAIVSPSPTCLRYGPNEGEGGDVRISPVVQRPKTPLLQPGPSSKWRLKEEQIKLCFEACVDHFEQIMRTVKARDLTRELQDGFDLLRERGRGRYDMELPAFDTPVFNFLTDTKKAPWMPVVKEILGKDVVLIHKGAFLSLQDAEAQGYHQDGPHLTTQYQKPCHAINVFVPLVDLTTQGTEFCLGSHILGHEDYDRDFVETPQVSAGTPVIFDYRLGHRGLGNTSGFIRPVVYCTYAAAADGKEFRDSVNFSRKRYHQIGELVSRVPTREERARKREQMVEDKHVEKVMAESLEEQKSKPEGSKIELREVLSAEKS